MITEEQIFRTERREAQEGELPCAWIEEKEDGTIVCFSVYPRTSDLLEADFPTRR